MTTTQTVALPDAPMVSPADAPGVWDHLWRHQPSQTRDDHLLEREANSHRWKTIVKEAELALGSLKGLRSIELGSGRGDFSVLLSRLGVEVTLLDASPKALDQAQRRFDRLGLKANFVSGNLLCNLQQWSGQFDMAFSSGVIEHFKGRDRSQVIAAHKEVLSPGGLAVMSVPNAWCIPYRIWKAYLELRKWWPYGMEIPYSPRELTHRSINEGFQQVRYQCFGFMDSVRIHWLKGLLKCETNWLDHPSALDRWMGLALVVFARRSRTDLGSRR